MINGGTATVFVSNMDQAVKFYTDALGMKIQYRAGDDWCSIDAGGGLIIGLHPSGPKSPKPGSRGAISVGLGVTEPIEKVVAELKKRGVVFESDVVDDDPVKLAFFGDPDGNELYLCEYKGN